MRRLACGITHAAAAAAAALALAASPAAARAVKAEVAVKGLPAEIAAWENRDMTRDPKADLAALTALKARVDADGTVPPLIQANLMTTLAAASFYAMDFAASVDWTEKAVALFEAHGSPPERIAEAYNNRSAILRAMGRLDEAEAAGRKAVDLRRQLYREPSPEIASSVYNLATVLYSQGRYEEAVGMMRDALRQQLATQPDAVPALLQRMTGLAAALNESGREAEGVEVARQAEQIGREKLGDAHPVYSVAINNLGTNLNDAGRFAEAIPVLREALRVREKSVGQDHVWTAYSMRNLAFALEATRSLDEAQSMNEGALAIMRRNANKVDAGAFSRILGSLATLAAHRQDWPLYDRRIVEAMNDADTHLPEASPDRAYTHVFHASMLQQRQRHAEALPIAEKWVPVMQRGLPAGHRNRIWAEMVLASLRQHAGDVSGALSLAEPAVAHLRNRLTDLSTSNAQLAREALSVRKVAVNYLEMAAAMGDQERAFAALQLIGLTDLSLGQTQARDAQAADGTPQAAHSRLLDLARREEELEKRYTRALKMQTEAATLKNGNVATLAATVERLVQERAAVHTLREAADAALRRDFPDFVALRRPGMISLAEFRAQLAPGEVVLMPVEWPGGSWSVRIDRKGLRLSRFDAARVRGYVTDLRRAVDTASNSPSPYPFDAAHGLFRALLPQGIKRGTRLLLFGGHQIASLPLSILVTRPWQGGVEGAPWLLRDASIQVLGNLSLFSAQRRAPQLKQPFGQSVLYAFAGPDLPPVQGSTPRLASLFRSAQPDRAAMAQLPPLPEAAREVRAMAAALPGPHNRIMIGESGGEAQIKGMDLTPASVIAFATHGLLADELHGLWEPALLVGVQGGVDVGGSSGEDGLLGASEIARLRLAARLVILSACNTAAGDSDFAPVYSGLATAFAEAGAKALLVSHWRVRDDAAARLSVGTVQHAARGAGLADALRRTQLDLMADRTVPGAAHPAIWAPFVLVEN